MATSLADVTRHNDSALLLIAARVCRSLRKAVPGPVMHPNAWRLECDFDAASIQRVISLNQTNEK